MVEKAFEQKNIPNECKSEILLKLVEEKDVNFPVYINEEELEDYEKIKSLILKEYEPSPIIYSKKPNSYIYSQINSLYALTKDLNVPCLITPNIYENLLNPNE